MSIAGIIIHSRVGRSCARRSD